MGLRQQLADKLRRTGCLREATLVKEFGHNDALTTLWRLQSKGFAKFVIVQGSIRWALVQQEDVARAS